MNICMLASRCIFSLHVCVAADASCCSVRERFDSVPEESHLFPFLSLQLGETNRPVVPEC